MSHLKIILSFVLLTITLNASATLIYNDRAEWEAAVGSFTTDTYNEVVTDQVFVTLDRGDYVLDGSTANDISDSFIRDLLLDVASYAYGPENPVLSNSTRVNVGGMTGSFFITFDSKINAFGFDIINYDNGNDKASIAIDGNVVASFPEEDTMSFFGFIGGAVSQVEIIADSDPTYHAFDNVSYRTVDVPEPSTLAIFALGMIGLASRRFKK